MENRQPIIMLNPTHPIYGVNGTDDYSDNDDNNHDPIYMITQFFIHSNSERQKEIRYSLKRNVESGLFKKIFLLNEREYTMEELGLIQTNPPTIITQIIINKRLTFASAFTHVMSYNVSGYIVLCNSDIFFDESLYKVYRGTLSKIKGIQCLLRYEYQLDKPLSNCTLFGPRPDSQ